MFSLPGAGGRSNVDFFFLVNIGFFDPGTNMTYFLVALINALLPKTLISESLQRKMHLTAENMKVAFVSLCKGLFNFFLFQWVYLGFVPDTA